MTRRVFTMASPEDALRAEKQFQQRRAGLLPPDDAADQAFLATLRLVEPPVERQPWHLRTVRELTENERERFREGRFVAPGEVVREDIWAARLAAHNATARAGSARRAERAQQEAARLAREAKRFDAP